MEHLNSQIEIATPFSPGSREPDESQVTIEKLSSESEQVVLDYLDRRPIETGAMAGFIRDNGIISSHHRGTFYGCWNSHSELEGIALIGHATLFEAETLSAVKAFAELAKSCNDIHLLMAESLRMHEFLRYYTDGGQAIRRSCEQILFGTRRALQQQGTPQLRHGTLDDLDLIVPVHAHMCYAESGVDPLRIDPSGFRGRCSRRLKQNRIYVWVEQDELMFKADIISETPDAIYLEGIWINPRLSGSGKALVCLSHVVATLLNRTHSICVLTNVENRNAIRLYQRAGFTARALYESVFLEPRISTIH